MIVFVSFRGESTFKVKVQWKAQSQSNKYKEQGREGAVSTIK